MARPQTSHGHLRRDLEGTNADGSQETERDFAPLMCQLAAQCAATLGVGPPALSAEQPSVLPLREELQNLISGLARRAAWGGDRRKGAARIELSEGALAGATLVVHAEQRSVRVELELPAGASGAEAWRQRILSRLQGRGFSADVSVD